ncbi:MAG: hypothetical protein ACLFPL_00605 [Candidatus Nanoarchaeia archaeon]
MKSQLIVPLNYFNFFPRFSIYNSINGRVRGYINNYVHGGQESFGFSQNKFSTRKMRDNDELEEYLQIIYNMIQRTANMSVGISDTIGIERILIEEMDYKRNALSENLLPNLNVGDFESEFLISFKLDYFTPKNQRKQRGKSIKSSIGSLQGKGDYKL